MADYANLENLLADCFPLATKQSEIDAIARLLTAASRYFDLQTHRPDNFFAVAAVDTVPGSNDARTIRTFYGNGQTVLRIDPFADVAIDRLQITTTVNGIVPNFILIRDNTNFAVNSGFRRSLQIVDETGNIMVNNSVAAWFKGEPYNISAHWGYAAIPAAIEEAIRRIVQHWRQIVNAGGVFGQQHVAGIVHEEDIPIFSQKVIDAYKYDLNEYGLIQSVGAGTAANGNQGGGANLNQTGVAEQPGFASGQTTIDYETQESFDRLFSNPWF